ncbi:MAG: class II aldolase/adducin family protein, partial [Spirochaetes bacterium]
MIIEGGENLFKQGLTVGTWGNLSIRDPQTNLIYIKPSGMPYPDIEIDDVVVMNKDREVVEGERKPSIEYNFHIAIMNVRDDVNAV